MIELNQIYCGNNLDIIKDIDSDSIQLTLTSCPYDDLRSYSGNKWDFETFKLLAPELYRVTKQGGYVVWVVGDKTEKGSESGTSFKQALFFKEIGFNLFDTMIYEKHNFANPSSNRYHQLHEYMFILSKGKPIIFNPIKDKPNKWAGKTCWGTNTSRQKDGTLIPKEKTVYADFGMRGNIWRYVTGKQSNDAKIAYKHPATYPLELAVDHIKSWTNPQDIVLDCFNGAGTSIIAAKKLDRNFIGIDIAKNYCEITQERYKFNFNEDLKINEIE